MSSFSKLFDTITIYISYLDQQYIYTWKSKHPRLEKCKIIVKVNMLPCRNLLGIAFKCEIISLRPRIGGLIPIRRHIFCNKTFDYMSGRY